MISVARVAESGKTNVTVIQMGWDGDEGD